MFIDGGLASSLRVAGRSPRLHLAGSPDKYLMYMGISIIEGPKTDPSIPGSLLQGLPKWGP